MLLLWNQDNWIVEVEPKRKRSQKSTFVPRYDGRTRLLVWRKDKVNEKFRQPVKAPKVMAGEQVVVDPEADYERTLAAHRRRGHWKTLRSPRFTHKRGKKIWVDATWVGPKEMVRGHETYRVRLDL